jgi:hypothetical protein
MSDGLKEIKARYALWFDDEYQQYEKALRGFPSDHVRWLVAEVEQLQQSLAEEITRNDLLRDINRGCRDLVEQLRTELRRLENNGVVVRWPEVER